MLWHYGILVTRTKDSKLGKYGEHTTGGIRFAGPFVRSRSTSKCRPPAMIAVQFHCPSRLQTANAKVDLLSKDPKTKL